MVEDKKENYVEKKGENIKFIGKILGVNFSCPG